MTAIRLSDADSAHDLATFVGRAKRLAPDGDIRLQCVERVLAAWVCVLPGSGLIGSGVILGLRTYALAESSTVDVTVPLSAVTDRLARDETLLPIPPVTTAPTWTALSPPRSGWESVGEIPAEQLEAAALAGIEEVAVGAPEGSGAAAVADLRRRVWQRSTPTVPVVSAGAAFGMHALGFLGRVGAPRPAVRIHAAGPWTRATSPAGFVLTR